MIGFYIDFRIEQILVKKDIREKLIVSMPDKDLTIIKVTSENIKNIRWTEEGEEFMYCNSMYDIVRTTIVNGTTYYYCYNDKQESSLIASVDKLIKEQMDHSRSKNITKKPVINYFYQKNVFSLHANERTFHYSEYSQQYFSVKPDVTSPPPKPSIS